MYTPYLLHASWEFHLAWVVLDNINVLSPPRGVCPSLHSTLFKISESSIKSTFVGDFYFSVYKIFNIFGHFLDNFLEIILLTTHFTLGYYSRHPLSSVTSNKWFSFSLCKMCQIFWLLLPLSLNRTSFLSSSNLPLQYHYFSHSNTGTVLLTLLLIISW